MSSLNVVRVKRKADEEPAEALVIALKRSKREDDESDEVFLKLATTFTSAAEFNDDFLQNAITQDKNKIRRRKPPKHVNSCSTFSMRLHTLKLERKQRREQVLADRRLILAPDLKENTEECENSVRGAASNSTDVRGMFKLYDIIEENEESKCLEQDEEKNTNQSSISCNGVRLIRLNGSREDVTDYVYDVYYVTNGNLDDRFVDGSVSVQPYAVSEELTYDSDEPEEYYEDEDDSNEECNWRNDYPDEDSDSENEKHLNYYDDENVDPVFYAMQQKFEKFCINQEKLSRAYATFKANILEGFANDDEDFIL